MKKLRILVAVAFTTATLCFTNNAKAQTTAPNDWRFGLGPEVGAVTGAAHQYSNVEVGGTARLQYGLSKKFALTFTSGYYDLLGKINPYTNQPDDNLQIIPIKVGAKYFFANNVYFGAETGVGLQLVRTNTKFIASPALGFAGKHVDVGLRYEYLSGSYYNYGILGLRVAYAFGL